MNKFIITEISADPPVINEPIFIENSNKTIEISTQVINSFQIVLRPIEISPEVQRKLINIAHDRKIISLHVAEFEDIVRFYRKEFIEFMENKNILKKFLKIQKYGKHLKHYDYFN